MTNVYEIKAKRKWKAGRSQGRRKKGGVNKNMFRSLSPLNNIRGLKKKFPKSKSKKSKHGKNRKVIKYDKTILVKKER